MGKYEPGRPYWTKNLDGLIAHKVRIRATCTECRAYKDVDLHALREKLGGEYSLWNRRTKCRLTPDCKGNNRFRHDGFGGTFIGMMYGD